VFVAVAVALAVGVLEEVGVGVRLNRHWAAIYPVR
jgi:hypothetical protein